MNALFALALLASPLRAGVVVPVESAVAPAGPSAPVVPVAAPAGGLIGSPAFGGLDLRGALPLLPSPVPGLVGPALNFVGSPAPEAAAVRPEAAAAPAAPTPAPSAVRGRRAEQTPALPAQVSPGSPALAISRDRNSSASTPENGASRSRSSGEETPSTPLVETSSLEHARPEKAAGLGRKFFDQSSDKNRGEIADRADAPAADGQDGKSVIASLGGHAGFGGGYGHGAVHNGLEASNAGGRGKGYSGLFSAPEGETLHDALASVPGAAAPRGAVSFFRSASPNGNLSATAGAAGTAFLGVPRPLALDLSPSGLIVRVRSALNGAIVTAPAAAASAPLPAPGPSTALLERGGMLEAFSVARAHAESAVAQSISSVKAPRSGASRAATPFAPAPVSRSAPSLWWALLALPLFVAAVRGIL